jgi:periplasmic protein TonB
MPAQAQDASFLSTRAVVLIVIIALHVLLAWGLATGLARKAIELIAPPIQSDIIEEVQQHDLPPPPPPPEFERPPVEVPPPDISIDLPVDAPTTTAIRDITDRPVQAAPPHVSSKTAVSAGKNFPNSSDFYPPASLRMGEEGSVAIHVCIGPNGKVTEEPTVAKSSGSSRLDEAGIKLAKAGAGHYNPATEDGKPITSCVNLPIKFKIN